MFFGLISGIMLFTAVDSESGVDRRVMKNRYFQRILVLLISMGISGLLVPDSSYGQLPTSRLTPRPTSGAQTAPGAPARPATPTKPAPSTQRRSSTPTKTTRTVSSKGKPVSFKAAKIGGYEPFKNREIVYREVPDIGEAIDWEAEGLTAVTEFLSVIAAATSWNIVTTAEVEKLKVRFWLFETKPLKAMEVLRFHGVYYDYDPDINFLYVMTLDEYFLKTYGSLATEQFKIEFADLQDIETSLGLLRSNTGWMITDPRTSTIMVWDTQDNIDAMRPLIEDMDVKIETREFSVKYIDVDNFMDSLDEVLSDRGTAQVDARLNILIVTDQPTRLDVVQSLIDAMDKEVETRTWILNYMEPDSVADKISHLIPEEMGEITLNEEVHQITITALPERLDRVDVLIKEWDIKRRQVQIEAHLVTVSKTMARELGIDWAYFGSMGSQPFSLQHGAVTTNFFDPSGDGDRLRFGQFPGMIFDTDPITGEINTDIFERPILERFTGDSVAAVLDYLDSKGDVKVLSHPRVTVQDGQEAAFENTSSVPYVGATTYQPTSSRDQSGSYSYSYRPSNQIQFLDVGTILRVLPRISDEDSILLDIAAEESTFEMRTIVGNNEESTVPEKKKNSTETQVLVQSGQTVVIGGLRTDRFSDTSSGVPILGNLPLIGRAFRNTKKDHQNSELLIFITSTIRDHYTDPEAYKLAAIDEEMERINRRDLKGTLGRISDKLSQGRHDRGVAVGETGEIFSGGKINTIEELRVDFASIEFTDKVTVTISSHPYAPEEVIESVREAAEAAGMKAVIDKGRVPFVPAKAPEEE